MKILLFGELGIDRFIYGDCKRLAPDGPWAVLQPTRTVENPGIAGNVKANILSLRPDWKVDFIHNKTPIIKTRYLDQASNHCFLRVDENDEVGEKFSGYHEFLDYVGDYDTVVFSDYDKGFLDIPVCERILGMCDECSVPTFMDTKKKFGAWSRKLFCAKINKKEYLQHNEPPEFHCRHLVETLGDKGAYLYSGNVRECVPGYKSEVYCVSGAGDSFLAGLVVKFLESGNLKASVGYANAVGAISVSRRGVHAVREEELAGILSG